MRYFQNNMMVFLHFVFIDVFSGKKTQLT